MVGVGSIVGTWADMGTDRPGTGRNTEYNGQFCRHSGYLTKTRLIDEHFFHSKVQMMNPRKWIPAAFLVAWSACAPALAEAPAFPGAEGYGQSATGWRNGAIVKVTNTAESGPGSLRACLELGQPRLCLIEVGGTIDVDRTIFVAPNVYVAGQTAPGDGIQLKLSGKDKGTSPLVIKNSHDVVIRFVRIRPGPGAIATPSVSALLIENSRNIMLDHLSLMFASDQNFSVHIQGGSTHDVTLQRSIVAWGLQKSNHPKGKHSKGALICSATIFGVKAGDRCGRITLWENVFAHNNDRNPDVKSTGEPVEIVSNVFYNPKSQFGEFYDLYGETQVDYVGNVALAGPSTRWLFPPYSVQQYDFDPLYSSSVFLQGNLNDRYRPDSSGAESLVVDPKYSGQIVDQPFSGLTKPAMPADSLLASLLPVVGTVLPDGRFRDALDARVVSEVHNRRGSIIDHPDEVGGYPELATGDVPADSDDDGMPDMWETSHPGLDPFKFDAWKDRNSNGLSNIEEYLSVLAGDIPDQRQ
jgi:pectate lyase